MLDRCGIKGVINIKRLESGILLEEFTFDNIITDDGFLQLEKMIGGDSGGINSLALGTNNTPAAVSDHILYNKIILVNTNRDYSIPKKVKFLAIIPENTFSVTTSYLEGGLIYKSGPTEILITRVVFDNPVFQKASNSLSISYDLILS